MPDFRRMIVYIYSYQNGKKKDNSGFAKLEQRAGRLKINMNIKGIRTPENYRVYMVFCKENKNYKAECGQLIRRGIQGEYKALFYEDNISGKNIEFGQCVGIMAVGNVTYAGFWSDINESVDEIREYGKDEISRETDGSNAEIKEINEDDKRNNENNKNNENEDNKDNEDNKENQEKGLTLKAQEFMQEGDENDITDIKAPLQNEILNDKKCENNSSDEKKEQTNKDDTLTGQNEEMQDNQINSEKINSNTNQNEEIQNNNQINSEKVNSNINQNEKMQKDNQVNSEKINSNTNQNEEIQKDNQVKSEKINSNTNQNEEMQNDNQIKSDINKLSQTEYISDKAAKDIIGKNWWKNLYGCRQAYSQGEFIILKIDIKDIKYLPKNCWIFGRNSFVMHGYYNFRHLAVLRKENGEYFLGVAGTFDQNEQAVAGMFGFKTYHKTGSDTVWGGYWLCLIDRD